jgi:Skp family chaperone for outer membrane proteins
MKKIFILINILIFTGITNFSMASANIVYVDMDKVLTTTKAGSFLLKQFNTLDKKNLDKFIESEKNLTKKETNLISQKKILSEIDFQNKLNELRQEVQNYNKTKQKILYDSNQKKTLNTKEFLKLINPILTKYSDNNNISIILKKKDIIIGKSKLDITNKIIELVNLSIKEKKIK